MNTIEILNALLSSVSGDEIEFNKNLRVIPLILHMIIDMVEAIYISCILERS